MALFTSEDSNSVSLQGVPDVAIEVVVAGQEKAAALAEGYAGDSTHHLVSIADQLLKRDRREERERDGRLVKVIHSTSSLPFFF